jgi:serine protease Do
VNIELLSNANRELRRFLHFACCMLLASAPFATAHGTPLAALEEAALRAAAEGVAESVVQIRTIGGLDSLNGTLLPGGPTTGLVISSDGYIVSSAFNFVQQPASIVVTLASGKQVPAELVATDHSRMIVLLKVAGVSELPLPEVASSGDIRVGQWAIALGRTFRADRPNISIGIVSAANRMFGKVLQTDADVSTANYGGPLVDIRGRVLGVIVPMAPQGAGEMAGVEWYDSGIGFAVPLHSIQSRLEQMKQGKDQYAGILGIGMLPKNPHSAPAELAAVRPDSPAGRAGLKKGDRIVEIDGQPIENQTALRFALGARYGGESIDVVIERGEERIERSITLVGELPAFRHAFLGILPRRPASEPAADRTEDGDQDNRDGDAERKAASAASDGKDGVKVRMVYTGSPAEIAGVQVGDRILRINGVTVDSIEAAIAEMNNVAPDNEVSLQLLRGDQPTDVTLTATHLPANVPSQLPPAYAPDQPSDDDAAAVATPHGETRDLNLPEFSHKCRIYVPASYEVNRPHGVLLWLHGNPQANVEEAIRTWQSICDRDRLLLVMPTTAEGERWDRTQLEYLGRLMRQVMTQYTIDSRRVVVGGHDSGGAMAWLLALSGRELFRGVVPGNAPLPRQVKLPANEPSQRLAIFASIPQSKDASVQVSQGLQKCSDAGYPVSTLAPVASGEFSDAEREELARWIDTLDRF